jgi:single-stranded-DNA-specific exonuclease
MPNLPVAVQRLAAACRNGEHVAILGDFDVDGVTATTILTEGLTALGAHPIPYLPDRFTEGYGPNIPAVTGLHAQGASLLVTADCGTSAVAEVAVANALGMDVVVIDHHSVPEALPAALAIVNPKLAYRPGPALGTADEVTTYGSEPAACGVAYKVIHDLHDTLGRPYDAEPHRALVALGTVCDLAPMLAENRDLVRLGMDALARSKRPGLRALAAVAGLDLAAVDPEACGWVLGPRLNAAGRMEHAKLALELLLTGSPERAEALAAQLETLNLRRRALTTEAVDLAIELLGLAPSAAPEPPTGPSEGRMTSPAAEEGESELSAGASETPSPLVGEGWGEGSSDSPLPVVGRGAGGEVPPLLFVATPLISSGIVGLAAARLAELFHRPAIVAQLADGEARASCRSIPTFDITALLRRHGHLFKKAGGHRAAAGFTLDAAKLDEARAVLMADAAEHLTPDDLTRSINIDCELPLASVNGELLRWLYRLAPHGIGNDTPRFLGRGVTIQDSRVVGQDGAHLQFTLREGRVTWRAIAFRKAERAVPDGELADIVYTFKRDGFRDTLQLEVLDLRPHEAANAK